MSRVFITASADTSIYEQYTNLNTGHDEVLEVGKKKDKLEINNGQVRSLIKFTLTDLPERFYPLIPIIRIGITLTNSHVQEREIKKLEQHGDGVAAYPNPVEYNSDN